MTNEELLKRLVDVSTRRHGENAFSTRIFREQLAHAQQRRESAMHRFYIGGRGKPQEGDPPGGQLRKPGTEPTGEAEVEAEEEKRQHEER